MTGDAMPTLSASAAKQTPCKIGVMVHNTIERDARVLKEIRTLEAAGFDVTAFGLVGKPDEAKSIRIDGIKAGIHLGKSQLFMRHKPVKRQIKRLTQTSKQLTKFRILAPLALFCAFSAGLSAGFATASSITGLLAAVPVILLALIVFGVGRFARKREKKALMRSKDAYVQAQAQASSESVAGKRRLIRCHSIALEQLAEAHGPFDVVHCHDIIALEAGTQLARRHGWRLIWDAHELYEHLARDEPSRAKANRQIIEEAEGLVQGCITISESFADYYRREHPGLPQAAVVMNATLATKAASDDGRLRRAAKLPPEARILIYQGGFSPHRGLHNLIEAMAFVDEPWALVMMGWGNLEAELKDLAAPVNANAAAVGQPPKIAFIPPAPQAELDRWTAGAALGIIAYEDNCLNHTYCTPNKLWEYPNAGVPVLASNLVEIRKLILEFDTGFLMPTDSGARALAKQINAIDAGMLAIKRDNCMSFREQHNWSRFEPALLGVYEELKVRAEAA